MIAKLGSVLCLTALALAPAAWGGTTIQSLGRVQIIEAGGIAVVQGLSFTAQLPAQRLALPGAAAQVRLTGVSDAVSLQVPSMFDLTRAGGLETLTVVTTETRDRTVVGGALRGNGALSIDVAGAMALRGEATPPGAYHGFLVVVAQYN